MLLSASTRRSISARVFVSVTHSTIRASLSEQITSDVDATATYLFRHRDSNESQETATENAVLFTLTKTF